MELSFNIIKPDGIRRGLAGRIITRLEDKGLVLVALKLVWPSKELIEATYSENAEEEWFPTLVEYLMSGPCIAMVWKGDKANEAARQVIGDKNPLKSDSGSLRGKYNLGMVRTIVHGSRTPEEASKEIPLWFGPSAIPPLYDVKLDCEMNNEPCPADHTPAAAQSLSGKLTSTVKDDGDK